MIRDTKTLNIAIWALLIGGVISIISPIFFRFGRVAGYELQRYGGLWGDQNEFAALLLVLIPLSVVNIITSRRNIYKIISVAISATLITGVILTYSRGGFLALGLMVVLAMFKLTSGRKRLKILAISVPCMIVAFALFYYFFSEDIIARMETLKFLSSKEAVTKDASLKARYYFYFELTPKIFSEHPIFGLGLRQIIFNNPYHYVTHNTFFEVLTGTGLLGFIPFILIIVLSWKELRTVVKAEGGNDYYLRYCALALELGLLAYLFAGLFVSLDMNKMLWLTISMAAVVFNLYRINTGNSHQSVNRSRNRDHYNDRRLTYPNRV
jgi:O-antigen ligase